MECADADKYDRIYCNALTVINKIVFTSPEAMVEFCGKKNITSALVKTFANIYSFERSILLRATGKQKSPITNHATTLCKECEIKSLSAYFESRNLYCFQWVMFTRKTLLLNT